MVEENQLELHICAVRKKKADIQNITKVEKENITQKIPNFGLAI